uniref:RK RWP-RK domain n=1 Tax=Siphoviridae sp. ct8eQ1 TaxID=2826171 RepID=A0A8S5N0T1_9CAUD|nr:MAG TPA: RK RWP-RK domain [Siphoviridae sp. ct8eQ1]
MSRIIKMVDEIKEYYNLNDTLLASDLGIMQQTIRGWRDGRQPSLLNYNKVKKMYEEMKQEAVDESIVKRFEALEEKVEKKPYRVEMPRDIGDYYNPDEYGTVEHLEGYSTSFVENCYIRGLTFKTVKEAEQYDKERILLFKLHKWAEEQNGNWYPYWEQSDDKFYIYYFYNTESFCVGSDWNCNTFNKLPYFKSHEIAEQFIEEFGDEIKEVLC